MEDPKTVVISMNPSSGASDRRNLVEDLKNQLERLGFRVQIQTDIGVVEHLVGELLKQNPPDLKAVVAAGGDGTVTLLANRLPREAPLAILPLGTENLLAKHLRLKADPKLIAQSVAGGKLVWLDAGRANGDLFLVMASCGFDADVVHRLHSKRQGHIRHWSYAKPIFGAIGQYRYPKLRFIADGEPVSEAGKWAFVFNVPRYAMNLPIVDDADPTDGRLDLCTFRGGSLIRGLFYVFAVLLRRHRKWKYAQHRRFATLRIESDEPVPYQLDGDPGGMLPLEIKVIPKCLRVFVPEAIEGKLIDSG